MKNKINKTPKWHLLSELPRSKESRYLIDKMPVIVIISEAVEETLTQLVYRNSYDLEI
jgi:hypothetical protein